MNVLPLSGQTMKSSGPSVSYYQTYARFSDILTTKLGASNGSYTAKVIEKTAPSSVLEKALFHVPATPAENQRQMLDKMMVPAKTRPAPIKSSGSLQAYQQALFPQASPAKRILQGEELSPEALGTLSSYLDPENVLSPSGLSGDALERKLRASALEGLGSDFKTAEEMFGINALFLMGLAVHESNFGKSRIAQDKNNLFGFKAYDQSPYHSAQAFDNKADSIYTVASYLSKNYLQPEGKYYQGTSIRAINQHYATDPNWHEGIAQRIKQLIQR